ncbi:Cytochrome P [Parasponia andersonii]|uniref:Cytochrome P n=1 Tax=Parasponia andersonii TaxID=3476 RepID=A0A2P5B3V9_PARAD|nr:Cytochrome P [Parasponia andersonii]
MATSLSGKYAPASSLFTPSCTQRLGQEIWTIYVPKTRASSNHSSLITRVCQNDIVLAPHGDYWRQLRKACMQELLSIARVQAFRPIREEELLNLIEWSASSAGSAINLTEDPYANVWHHFAGSLCCGRPKLERLKQRLRG